MMTRQHISDEELWQILGWKPTSRRDRAGVLFPWSPDAWPHGDRADNTPSSEWVAWAKRQIQEPDNDHVLYLCRLIRLLELFHTDRISDRPGVRFDLLNAAMVSGLAVAGGDASHGLTHLVEYALQMAEQRGLVLNESTNGTRGWPAVPDGPATFA